MSLYQISNYNDVRIVNFATTKNLVVKGPFFAHRNFHKYTWTSPDGNYHKQIDHILIGDGIRVYQMYEVSGELTVILITIWWLQKLGLAVSKQAAQKFNRERYNPRKLNELEIRTVSDWDYKQVCSFGELKYSEDTNRAWENIKENIQISAKESLGLQVLKQYKPWFDEECLDFLDQRKRVKMQLLQDQTKVIHES